MIFFAGSFLQKHLTIIIKNEQDKYSKGHTGKY